MRSDVTEDFTSCFRKLPARVQRLARKNYKLWARNPSHPALQFKRVGVRRPVYSIRVGIGWRALGLKMEDTMVRFWIGFHAEYDGVVAEM